MIDFGIPKALQWIDVQEGRLSKKEFLRPRIEAFMKYIEEAELTYLLVHRLIKGID